MYRIKIDYKKHIANGEIWAVVTCVECDSTEGHNLNVFGSGKCHTRRSSKYEATPNNEDWLKGWIESIIFHAKKLIQRRRAAEGFDLKTSAVGI